MKTATLAVAFFIAIYWIYMNITLIGMPGAGKSYIGRKLAQRLELVCLEIDEIIEKEYRLLLPEVVEKLGDAKFLQREAEIAISQTRGRDDLVISPGGSLVYRVNAMKHLKKISKVIYLKVPLHVIEKRIGVAPRAIVGAKRKSLADIYAERIPLYEKYADHTVNGDRDRDVIVADLLRIISPGTD